MPRLKQPASLKAISFEVLLNWILLCCRKYSATKSVDKLRRGVAFIKQNILNGIPESMLTNFCSELLEKFYKDKYPESHRRAVSEMIMDLEKVELSCSGRILSHINPVDAGRLRRLKKLNLDYDARTISLENLNLQNLTNLSFKSMCTDPYLTVIGQNCPNLQVLHVAESRVTDVGLRALKPCTELRDVNILSCEVSHNGVNDLLSTHKKLWKFSFGRLLYVQGCCFQSNFDSSVCQSMKYIYLNSFPSSCVPLHLIVTKFPNLTHLKIDGLLIGDLTSLKVLNNLTSIGLHYGQRTVSCGHQDAVTFESLKELLKIIGSRITTLKITHYGKSFYFYQDDVNFVYDFCPGIETFSFEQAPREKYLVIPPFKKLKNLAPLLPSENPKPGYVLEYSILPNLETLFIYHYVMSAETIEEIIFDNEKFPNLKKLSGIVDDTELMKIAKMNNLDITFE